MNFMELETSRLLLRKLSFEDLYEYYERLLSDGEVSKYLMLEPHQDIGETLQELERTLERYEQGDCLRWAIVRKEDGQFVGTVELVDYSEEERECSFLIMVAKDCRNQGFATEAVAQVLRFAREELGVERITAEHFAVNAPAGRMLEKLGMAKTGMIPGKYTKHGQAQDVWVWELSDGPAAPLTADEYQHKAMATLNPAMNRQEMLLNGVMGLCGESGECIDLVKKHLFHGHDLDREKLARELGDVAWYLAETACALELSLEEIFRGNLDKLKKRYPKGFDSERSINR